MMNILPYVTYLHIMSSIALFVSWGIEYWQIAEIRRPLTAKAGESSLRRLRKSSKYSMLAMLITLGTGIWLMISFWDHGTWMVMAMVSLLFIIVIGISSSRMAVSSKMDKFRSINYLAFSIRLRITIGMGIVALMVFKTLGLISSSIIVLIFLIAGIVWVFPLLRKIVA